MQPHECKVWPHPQPRDFWNGASRGDYEDPRIQRQPVMPACMYLRRRGAAYLFESSYMHTCVCGKKNTKKTCVYVRGHVHLNARFTCL